MAITAIPILPVSTVSGNQYNASRYIEENAQTFKIGTVVALASGDGGLIAWAGSILTGAVGSPVGVSYEAASNLATTGVGAPPLFGSVGKGAAAGTFGSVQNQSSAVNIAHGAPLNDGRCGVILASAFDTIFTATFGNAGAAAAPAATDVGASYGLTIDTGGNFWYVDKSKTGASAAVKVVGIDPRDGSVSQTNTAGIRVLFSFLSTVVQQLSI